MLNTCTCKMKCQHKPFQRIHGFEAVYAAGALCGVTMRYHRDNSVWITVKLFNCFNVMGRNMIKKTNFQASLFQVVYS